MTEAILWNEYEGGPNVSSKTSQYTQGQSLMLMNMYLNWNEGQVVRPKIDILYTNSETMCWPSGNDDNWGNA